MKRLSHLFLALAGGLTLLPATGVRADDTVLTGNPYAVVAVRNIFGLNPPAPVNATPVDATPPPKITPNGIMSIFGQLQVLFKVTPVGKAPKPGGDDAYILSEGQRQDDIEVVKINEKAGIVTFNNHGTVQELPLVAATATTGAAPAAAAGANPALTFRPAGVPTLPGNNYNNRALGAGAGGRFGGGTAGTQNSGGAGNNNLGAFGTPSGITTPGYHQEGPSVDPAAQQVIIEALRQHYQNQGDSTALILPPTDLTPPADSGK
jgi:hypothetical protein